MPGWREFARSDWRSAALLLLVGIVVSGALSGLGFEVVGLLLPIPYQLGLGVFGLVGVVLLMHSVGVLPLRLPEAKRQIPRHVLERGRLGAFQFGIELGSGLRTYMSASAPYLLAVGLVLSLWPTGSGVLVGLGFGIGRAAVVGLPIFMRIDEMKDTEISNVLSSRRVQVAAVILGLVGGAFVASVGK